LSDGLKQFFRCTQSAESDGSGQNHGSEAHEGEIKVETKEGEGAEFIIQLPLT
jgi:hypothetical protein